MKTVDVSIIDLEDLTSGDAARAAKTHEAIRHGLGHYGLIYVKNHGIAPETLDRFYAKFLEFTRRDEAEKATLGGASIWFQRGWTPPNTEKAVVAGGQPDFKECYFAAPVPVDPVCQAQYPEIYHENVWPADSEAFSALYLSLGRAVHDVGLALLRGCEGALGIESGELTGRVEGGAHVSRALRYLPLRQEHIEQRVVWGEEHTDFNMLTLLPGGRFFDPQGEPTSRPDDDCGLYLRTAPTAEYPEGQIVYGAAPPGCLVAQVGQQLEILSGGRFLATPHVIRAPKSPGYSRTAFAHFVHSHAHAVLQPLPPFRNDATMRAYSPPVLAGTYSLKTLVDIGLAPDTALARCGYRQYDRLAGFRAAEGDSSR